MFFIVVHSREKCKSTTQADNSENDLLIFVYIAITLLGFSIFFIHFDIQNINGML